MGFFHFKVWRSRMSKVFVIHENDAWVEPLRAAFARLGTPYEEWFLDEGVLDLTTPPPEGVFYNRMSASSHTRGHTHAPEYAGAVIEHLERHGRLVVNGRRALQLELSKVAQYAALAGFDIPTPPTIAVVGTQHLAAAAEKLGFPVILKHNRAGKGLGVQLILSAAALHEAVAKIAADPDPFAAPRDGVWLVQRYIEAPEPFITRAEFINGKFLYAVRVDTSEGFELCPRMSAPLNPVRSAPQWRRVRNSASLRASPTPCCCAWKPFCVPMPWVWARLNSSRIAPEIPSPMM
jgi:glutathione synthase/RimK-type ligase-like ATP-grasp enzyme